MNVARLKGLMAENGDTQSDVAAYLGITRVAFNRKIGGKYEFKMSEISKIAEKYNVPTSYFFKSKCA